MNVLDLFSGIGGFSLGLERAGFTTVAFCEVEEYCRRVLSKHWPDVPIHTDIRELDGEQYRGTVDLISGGFPCQPFSVAGKQRGDRDDRHLWPEMLRIIREVQPAWVIGENVIGLEGLALDQCVSDLESDGFAVQVFDIPACGIGAIHRRHRLWIVAHANVSAGRRGAVSGSSRGGEPKLHGTERDAADADSGQLRQQSGRGGGESGRSSLQLGVSGEARIIEYADSDGRYKRGKCFTEKRGDGTVRAIGWPTEPPVCGADDGVPRKLDGDGLDAETMRDMRRDDGSQALGKWQTGFNVQESSLLQQQVLRKGQRIRKPDEGDNTEASTKGAQKNIMSEVWQQQTSREASSRLQAPDYSGDAMQPMPFPTASPTTKESNKNRAARLRALGNAVVPQVVEQIGLSILRARCATPRK